MDNRGLKKLLEIYKTGEFFKTLTEEERKRFDEYIEAFVYMFPNILPTEIKELVTAQMLCERVDMAMWSKNLDDMDSSTASTVKTIIETSRKYRNTLLDYYKAIRKEEGFGDVDIRDSFSRALSEVSKDGGILNLTWKGNSGEKE